MEITLIKTNKKQYLDLLLLGDESEKMIDLYLPNSDLYILKDQEVIGQICVLSIDEETIEVKNLSIYEKYQRRGYGKKLLSYIEKQYPHYKKIRLGTGDSDLTIPFYQSCGYQIVGRIKNFFIDNYDHIMIENGVQLIDMILLEKSI